MSRELERQRTIESGARTSAHRTSAAREHTLRDSSVTISGATNAEILHELRIERPDLPIPERGQLLRASETSKLLAMHYRGIPLKDIAATFGRDTEVIGQLLQKARIEHALTINLAYIDSAEFHQRDAAELALGPHSFQPRNRAPRIPPDLPPYLKDLYQMPLLTRADEAYFFRRYNYQKMNALNIQSQIDPQIPSMALVSKLEPLIVDIERIRNLLVECNLRLAVNIAKKWARPDVDFFEVVHVANDAIFKSVEYFDYMRGNKFSTYATWAIRQTLSREMSKNFTRASRFETGADEFLERYLDRDREGDLSEPRYEELRAMIKRALKKLEPREATIIRMRFGIDCEAGGLKEVGEALSITKERVRQIEVRAKRALFAHIAQDVEGVNQISWMSIEPGKPVTDPVERQVCQMTISKIQSDPVFRSLIRTLNNRPGGIPFETLERALKKSTATWNETDDTVRQYLDDMVAEGVLRVGQRKNGTPLYAISKAQREIFEKIFRLGEPVPATVARLLRMYDLGTVQDKTRLRSAPQNRPDVA